MVVQDKKIVGEVCIRVDPRKVNDVGVIYPTYTLIWSILAYLPTILSLIDLIGIK